MSPWRYILASLRHYAYLHAAVAAGVAVATAVITGALMVGDSMRGSLRGLVEGSLGAVDAVLVAERPFRLEMVRQWAESPALRQRDATAVPLVLSPGAATFRGPRGDVRRAAGLQVIGAPAEFWWVHGDPRGEAPFQLETGIALTETIAEELGVRVGDAVLLRLPAAATLPADSTLGEKEETAVTRRLEVTAILATTARSFPARFSLRPSQQAPRNVFVPLETLDELLGLDGRANAIALAGGTVDGDGPVAPAAAHDIRNAGLTPGLADFGLKADVHSAGTPGGPAYLRISADRLVLPPHVVEVVADLRRTPSTLVPGAGAPAAANDMQPAVTYLANRIAAGDRSIPYSTVVGVDSVAGLGPVLDEQGQPVPLADDEIALNDWAASELNVQVGDVVSLAWYEPETTHGRLVEAPPLELRVRAIVPLARADGTPTAAADPAFAPDLPGVTDQASIDDWDLPFELVEPVREVDEQYWDEHRTTPKAFVSLALATGLWSTRWGMESVLRVPLAAGDEAAAEALVRTLEEQLHPSRLGMSLVPVRQQALAAAAGTTPFDMLFLGFSFFLMASAVMLTALLFRLAIDGRAREAGLLLAVGAPAATLRRLMLGEAAIVALVGALVGVAGGVAYARLMVHGLNTWWVAATAAPFVELHVTPRSLAVGFAAGLLTALAAIVTSLRRFVRLPARQLLSGDAQAAVRLARPGRSWRRLAPAALLVAAAGIGIAARRLDGETQALAFFGGGALALAGALLAVRGKLEPAMRMPRSLSLGGLAARNARRNPQRTMLTLALAASASFLIVALSAFRLTPSDRGVGGFDLVATADVPLLFDLATPEGRRELGFSEEAEARLAGVEIIGFRVHDGDDASCLNLYRPTQPRILGAPQELAAASRFAWAASVEDSAEVDGADEAPPSPPGEDGRLTGWRLLDLPWGEDENRRPVTPMILDRNTAAYSLKLGLGDRLEIATGAPGGYQLEVVAMLANSVLQGDLVIGDRSFRALFPEEAGRRFFLVRAGEGGLAPDKLATLLETNLEDFGFDAVEARQRLGELQAVQNTYLSTFQSLGALGLLLGAAGLAVAQWRSVAERRGELALMQAAGFTRRRLAGMVLLENLGLLLAGLGLGCLAAMATVLPHALVQQVGLPWGTLAVLLGAVGAAGAFAAWAASRGVLRAPLLAALHSD